MVGPRWLVTSWGGSLGSERFSEAQSPALNHHPQLPWTAAHLLGLGGGPLWGWHLGILPGAPGTGSGQEEKGPNWSRRSQFRP